MASSNNGKGEATESVFATATPSPTKTEASEKSSAYYSAESEGSDFEAEESNGDTPVSCPFYVEIANTPAQHATLSLIDTSGLSITPLASLSSLQHRHEDETPTRGFAGALPGEALSQQNVKDSMNAPSQRTTGAIFGPEAIADDHTASIETANTTPIVHTRTQRHLHPSAGFVDLAGLVDTSSRAVDKQGARLLPDSAYFMFCIQHLATHQAWSY
jgi:hypothetical protein